MRISSRLYLGFGILLALVAALAGLVWYDLTGMRGDLLHLRSRELPALQVQLFVSRDLSYELAQAHTYLLSGEPWRLAGARSASSLIQIGLDEARRRSSDTDGPLLASAITQYAALEQQIERAERLSITAGSEAAVRYWDLTVTPASGPVEIVFERLQTLREERMLSRADAAIEHAERLRWMAVVVVLVALLVGGIATVALIRMLLPPILALVGTARRLEGGDLTARVERVGEGELRLLAESFNRMADRITLSIAKLNDAQLSLRERNEALSDAYGAVQHELELAARVQREILPADFHWIGVCGAAEMLPASDIGGDFYDVVPIDRRHGCSYAIIGDISGKGIAAALMMVFAVTTLRELCRLEPSPREVLRKLNEVMRTRFHTDREMYLTCVVSSIDYVRERIRIAKAGHEEPLLFRAEKGRCESIKVGGLFAGLFTDGFYEEVELPFHTGDRLILYTDGIIEARGESGEFFGAERLCQAVEAHGRSSAQDLLRSIRKAVEGWTGGVLPHDDQTIVVIEATGQIVEESAEDWDESRRDRSA